uniref:Glutamate carboxypeptidase 2 n=1 Tax=Ciona intestinalis TaxID=7719 RepID=F6ZAX9_CIOIN
MSKSRIIVLTVIVSLLGIGLGVIIGYFGHPNQNLNIPAPVVPTEDPTISQLLMNELSADNIKENLRTLTQSPHIAGRDQDDVVLVDLIKQRWLNDLDSVVIHPYNVLLSYPKQNDSNYISIKLDNGTEIDVSQRKELVIDAEQNNPNVVDPFNAYSAAGEPEGDLVYVNYARIEDFFHLNRTKMISTVGKICISRYGAIFRGDKAVHAELYGCIGLIIYSDPIDYTVPWSGVYPEDWYLPSTGAQRGTLWTDNGDPRTPNYPSIQYTFDLLLQQRYAHLPKIPVTPIGYIDAVKYLGKLAGEEVIDTWKGGMNITYRYGPGFSAEHSNSKIKMSVKTTNQPAIIHNVIGYIRGKVEPDRYVLFGNHRDAWVFGAIDPTSGTATMLELTRAFGTMLKRGWRPRRTLVFCSWGAEEYGLIGSTEWVEELQKELQARAIAYLNVDAAVQGNFSLAANGVASLNQVVFDSTKLVSNPNPAEVSEGRSTVYDTWKHRSPSSSEDVPSIGGLGSGSDYTAFLQVLGIASVDLRHTYDRSIGLASYPVYHSVYETFSLVEKFVDPGFQYHVSVSRVWGEIGRKLADSPVLPLDCRLYAQDLAKKRDDLITYYGSDMEKNGVDFAQLNESIRIFIQSANEIHQRIQSIDISNAYETRAINDQLMLLERSFIDQNPLPGRVAYRHVVSAPSQHNSYGSTAFPAVVDAMFDIDADPDPVGRWNEVKKQYSILVFHILSAAAALKPAV